MRELRYSTLYRLEIVAGPDRSRVGTLATGRAGTARYAQRSHHQQSRVSPAHAVPHLRPCRTALPAKDRRTGSLAQRTRDSGLSPLPVGGGNCGGWRTPGTVAVVMVDVLSL